LEAIFESELPESSQDIEFAFREPEPTRLPLGRRSLIDDPNLQNRRDQLVQIFEGCWGEIGWAIRKCKRPNDLATVFGRLNRILWNDLPLLLSTTSAEPGTRDALAKIRTELRSITKPTRVADELNRVAQARLQEVRSVLDTKLTRRQRKVIRKEFVDRWKEAQQASQLCQKLNRNENSLIARQKMSEATFARRELFRFLKSKRYELNPLNLANASAGLPFMGWRQSMRRCSREKSLSANGTHYQIFKAIRYLASTAKTKTARGLIEHFRKGIPHLPHRYKLARPDIADKWFFLERAIREAARSKIHQKEVPFEITRAYFRQTTSRSHIDILLAERASIKL